MSAFEYLFEPSLAKLRTAPFDDRAVAAKVPKDDRSRWASFDAGLPFALADLLAAVPAPRVLVWIVRHPLDVVCSLRPGIEASWSHNPRPPDWERWLERPLVERCARHWAYINSSGYHAVADDAVLVRYEDIVRRPGNAARCLLRRCGASPRRHADEVRRWVSLVSNSKGRGAYEARHQVRWSRDDHRVRVGRWRENLSADDINAVRPILGGLPERFGYALP